MGSRRAANGHQCSSTSNLPRRVSLRRWARMASKIACIAALCLPHVFACHGGDGTSPPRQPGRGVLGGGGAGELGSWEAFGLADHCTSQLVAMIHTLAIKRGPQPPWPLPLAVLRQAAIVPNSRPKRCLHAARSPFRQNAVF